MTDYIVKHWRGQFPLSQACWLNGLLVLLPFAVWFALAGTSFHLHPPTLFIFALLLVSPFLVLLGAAAWSGVGIWRSAGRRIDFSRPVWGWIARGAVVTTAAILVACAIILAGALREIILFPDGRAAASYEVALRGNTAVFHGQITTAAADELELLLKDQSVKRLAIAGSNGGDVEPALRLAQLIRARKLFVVALAQCDAACTLLLAAGDVRAVAPDTIMGFGSNAGSPDAMRLYRQAGLSAAFVNDLSNQKPDVLVEPTLRTLIASGFLTNIFVDANKRYVLARTWCIRHAAACVRTGRQIGEAKKSSGGTGDGK
jgi:hypothetical protein